MRLLALLYYRESLHFIQPFSLTFAALPKILWQVPIHSHYRMGSKHFLQQSREGIIATN
jgi:hypothetical protein